MKKLLRYFGRQLLRKKWKIAEEKLNHAGIKINVFDFVAIHFFIGTLLSIINALIIFLFFKNIIYVMSGLVVCAIIYYILITMFVTMLVDQRARYIEKVLPDALQLMAANLRSGLSTDEALIASAREEFGFLADRIRKAGNEIATGIPFADAFVKISENIDSSVLKQTINLIIEGESSGGELSEILESIAIDIRDTAMIQKEIRTMIMAYATFIFLAIAVIAPILYAVSTQLAGVLSQLSRAISVQFLTEKSPTLKLAPTSISQQFLLIFSYVNITIISIFGSFMLSLIQRGSEKYGLRYIPFILGLSFIIFYLGRIAMQSFFGGIKVL